MGIIKKLKQIIRECISKEWLDKDPFLNFKLKIHETHRNVLLESEFALLSSKPLNLETSSCT